MRATSGQWSAVIVTTRTSTIEALAGELDDQRLDPRADLVPDGSHGVEALASRVGEVPVLVPLAREHRAGVTAAHGDDDVRAADCVGRQQLRLLRGDVDADLGHGGHGDRVDLV